MLLGGTEHHSDYMTVFVLWENVVVPSIHSVLCDC